MEDLNAPITTHLHDINGPEVYSRKNWVGVCGPLPKTLTLFMTKICDFSLPYLWPDQKFDNLFMTVAAGTVALNIIYKGLLLMVLWIMMKK